MESDASFEQPRPISVRSVTLLLVMSSDSSSGQRPIALMSVTLQPLRLSCWSFRQPRPIALMSVTLQPEMLSDVNSASGQHPISLISVTSDRYQSGGSSNLRFGQARKIALKEVFLSPL